jgi:hypothetical protein
MKAKKASINSLLRRAVAERGARRVRQTLQSLIVDSRNNILTILANEGRHSVPQRYLRGEIFVASRGDIDLSSPSKAKATFIKIVQRLNRKLLEKTWAKIYLIPTGHPTLSLQIKLAVHSTTRLNTTDVFYLNGRYFDIDFDARERGQDRNHLSLRRKRH